MGCAPSIHVSQIRIIYCTRKASDDQSSTPRSSVSVNHLTAGINTPPGSDAPVTVQPEALAAIKHGDIQLEGSNLRQFLGPSQRIPTVRWTALLVFPRRDAALGAWENACKNRGLDTVYVTSQDQAVSHTGSSCPHLVLVVVDARCPRTLSVTAISSSLRGSHSSALTVVAVVKRNFIEKKTKSLETLLDNGVDRVWVESNSSSNALAELAQLERHQMQFMMKQHATQAVFAALDCSRDAIHITDHNHKIKYINKSCEAMLGYSLQDVLGRSIWEVHGSDNHRQELRIVEGRRQDSVRLGGKYCDKVLEVQESGEGANEEDNRATHQTFERRESKVALDISEAINLQLRRGKEWEGTVMCRRKSGDLVQLPSKVIPVTTRRNSGATGTGLTSGDYIVYASTASIPVAGSGTLSQSGERQSDMYHHNRGSVKSLRKPSYDIRSLNSDGGGGGQGGVRRQSIAKLHSVTIEAPITRVISIITAAQENSPVYVSQALEKVLEILRSKELYFPQLVSNSETLKPVPADPVATDLLGGLLSHSPAPLTSSGRRSSSDQSGGKSHSNRPNLSNLTNPAASEIVQLLSNDNLWGFDIIRLEELSEKRPLVWLGLSLMCQMNVPATLNCDEQTLQNWLTLIEANYHSDNTYHNSTHAADVLHATAYFLQRPRIASLLDPLDVACSLIAAVVHDVDHPGKNSAFLCNTGNELAVLYNDTSVLESHHSALSFKLTHTDNRVNIYKGLTRETYKAARKSVVDMVLATDMTKHFEHVSKFVNMLDKCSMTKDESSVYETVGETVNVSMLGTAENQQILRRMLIKCADVSNPLRPRSLCIEWANRIANEYFSQTEEEKRRALPIVMPQFDRTTCSIPKSQIGFIDFFISDMFEAWDALADIPECMSLLRSNYQYWQDLEKRGSISSSRPPSGVPEEEDISEIEEGGDLSPVD